MDQQNKKITTIRRQVAHQPTILSNNTSYGMLAYYMLWYDAVPVIESIFCWRDDISSSYLHLFIYLNYTNVNLTLFCSKLCYS